MKKKFVKTKAFFSFATFMFLIWSFIYVAGMILFLSYRENPFNANWGSIFEAISLSETKQQKIKIFGSFVVSFFITLAVPFALYMSRKKDDIDLYGQARFADEDDIKKEGLFSKKGIILGKYNNHLMKLSGYEFVLLAAPTRTGKGVGFVVPNLLTFTDSAVVLDIKGENFNLTSVFRKKYLNNQIYYFNPFSETTHRWNPLSYISKDPKFRVNDLNSLANTLYPIHGSDPFWPTSARNLFIGMALLVLETPKLPQTFGEILRQASGKGMPINEYIANAINIRKATDRPLSSACVDSLNRFLNNSENTMNNILSSMIAPLSIFENAVIDKATSANDFDLREVRKQKMTIYIHIPAKEVVQAEFILNLFFSQLINLNVEELPEQNPDLKYQCLLMMDELTAAGKISILAKGVGFMAGYNMRLALIIQSASQLVSTYGKEDADNIINNMGATLYFTPNKNEEAKEYSDMIGTQTVKSYSRQHQNIGALSQGNYSETETENYISRPLMLPQELLSLDKETMLIRRAGIPVVLADKIRFFKDDYFMNRYTAVPMQYVVIDGEKRKVPVPCELPSKNWRTFMSSKQMSDYYISGSFDDLKITTESKENSLLLDIINSEDENLETNAEDNIRDQACYDLAHNKVLEFAAVFDSLGTTDESVFN